MSFLNQLMILLERNDVPFSDNISKMTDKILSYIRINRRRLFTVGHYEKNIGYYIKYNFIDSKSKIDDLYVALLMSDNSSINDKTSENIKFKNPAAMATYTNKENGEIFYVLRLYVFNSIDDMENNISYIINKLVASPFTRETIYHELTHYINNKRQKIVKSYDIKDYISDKDVTIIIDKIKKYHNLTDEINAHFSQSATMFWNSIKKKSLDILDLSFDKFKPAFIYFYGNKAFDNLNDDNKKRILKRIYSFYEELKETMEKKKKKK